MSNPVIFKDLPATFPEEDKYKTPAAVSSFVFHVVLVTALVLIPLLIPQRIEHWRLMTLIAPLTPPAPPPAAVSNPLETPSKPVVPEIQPILKVDPEAVITPTEIPKEIARIIDEAPSPGSIGVPGGIPYGSGSSVLQGVLSASIKTSEIAPLAPPSPPPPPPPATVGSTPTRVGGNIREPKVIKLVPAVYPKLAIKARVTGTVVLEATLTAEGTVEAINVISGHPLLIPAAVECVKQWRYEPTYLNGEPVPVILTARVHFELGPLS
jgi:protein TonB